MSLSDRLLRNGSWGVDLMTPLSRLLGDVLDAGKQEERLYAQVVPVIEALMPRSHQRTKEAE
jgi:hypothetical protein